MTKKELLEKLEGLPDDAIIGKYEYDEETEEEVFVEITEVEHYNTKTVLI